MIVKKWSTSRFGTPSDRGLFTHKWGLDLELPSSHLFKMTRSIILLMDSGRIKVSFKIMRSVGSPRIISNQQNDLDIMRYDSSNTDYHEWKDLEEIRTVFSVIKRNTSSTTHGSLLADDDKNDFLANGANIFHSGQANNNLIAGINSSKRSNRVNRNSFLLILNSISSQFVALEMWKPVELVKIVPSLLQIILMVIMPNYLSTTELL